MLFVQTWKCDKGEALPSLCFKAFQGKPYCLNNGFILSHKVVSLKVKILNSKCYCLVNEVIIHRENIVSYVTLKYLDLT